MSEQAAFVLLTDQEGQKILVNLSQVIHVFMTAQKRTCLICVGNRRVMVRETVEAIAQQVIPPLPLVPAAPDGTGPARKANPLASIIGQNVKRYRLEHGLSQRRLLERLGTMHKRTLYNIEAGLRVPLASQMESLARALHVSEDDLQRDPVPRPVVSRQQRQKPSEPVAEQWGAPFMPIH